MREARFAVALSDAVVFLLVRAYYEGARSMTVASGQKAGSSLPQEVYCPLGYGSCRGKEAAVHLLRKNEQWHRRLAWRP